MWGIAADSSGNIWFTQYSGKGNVNPGGAIVQSGFGRIVRFNVALERFTSIPIPSPGSFPMRLTLDRQERIWFTEFLGNKIAVYDPVLDHMQEFLIPTNSSGPSDLRFDKQGNLWFSESYSRQVGMFNPQNKTITEYSLGTESASQIISSPVGIALDETGIVWVADHGGNWIVRFNPATRTIMKYPTHFPPAHTYPISLVNDLLIDFKGNIWFVEHAGNSVGYYDPKENVMIEFPIPTGPISTALWLALAPNGDIWFTEWSGNNIGVVHYNHHVPVTISTTIASLTLHDAEQVTIPLTIKNEQKNQGNGTLSYAWGSYNPKDISVTLSPQFPQLTSSTEIPARAEIRTSDTITPGDYTLALGIQTGTARIWTFIPVKILKSNRTNITLSPNIILFIGVLIALFSVLILLKKRSHRMKSLLK